VTPYNNVDQYVEYLQILCADRGLREEFVKKGGELIARRHSWESFTEGLGKIPGYVVLSR
jgi:hypothetical protein